MDRLKRFFGKKKPEPPPRPESTPEGKKPDADRIAAMVQQGLMERQFDVLGALASADKRVLHQLVEVTRAGQGMSRAAEVPAPMLSISPASMTRAGFRIRSPFWRTKCRSPGPLTSTLIVYAFRGARFNGVHAQRCKCLSAPPYACAAGWDLTSPGRGMGTYPPAVAPPELRSHEWLHETRILGGSTQSVVG